MPLHPVVVTITTTSGGTGWDELNSTEFHSLDGCVVADVGDSRGENFISLVDGIPVGYLKTAQQGPWISYRETT